MKDDVLVLRARRYAELKAQARALEAEAHTERDAVVAELATRGAKRLEHAGVRVTVTARRQTEYDAVALKARVKPSVFRRLTRVVVSHEAVKEGLEAGLVSAADVEACSTVTFSTPWPVVSELEKAA